MQTPEKTTPRPRRFAGRFAGCFLGALLILGLGAIVAVMLMRKFSLYSVEYKVSTSVSSSVNWIKKQPKLVVLTASIDVHLIKKSDTLFELPLIKIPLSAGETRVYLFARDNRIQYFIPTDKFSAADVEFQAKTSRLRIRLPAPRLDEELVEVQSDPGKIDTFTVNGWAKLDALSGAPLRQEARTELRRQVIATAAANPVFQELANANAREKIQDYLNGLFTAMDRHISVEVVLADGK